MFIMIIGFGKTKLKFFELKVIATEQCKYLVGDFGNVVEHNIQ